MIVPTRNRPRQLTRCLAALAALDYPQDRFEVLIVDDGSEHPPHSIVANWSSRAALRLLTQANAGPARARNHGAEQARGRWLAFLDDDCEPAPGWLQGFTDEHADTDELLGGDTENGARSHPCSVASQLLVNYVCGWLPVHVPVLAFFPSNNFAVSAEEFDRIGGFSEEFLLAAGEDREFCYRWAKAGGRLRPAPGAVVQHFHYLTLGSFCRQHFHYGRGAVTFRQILSPGDIANIRRPGSFSLGVCRHVLRSGLGWRRAATTLALLACSRAAYFAGILYERLAPSGQNRTIAGKAKPTSERP